MWYKQFKDVYFIKPPPVVFIIVDNNKADQKPCKLGSFDFT